MVPTYTNKRQKSNINSGPNKENSKYFGINYLIGKLLEKMIIGEFNFVFHTYESLGLIRVETLVNSI